jgi:hypothetical protein
MCRDVERQHNEVDQVMPGGVRVWKTLKGLFQTGLVFAMATFIIQSNGDPTIIGLVALLIGASVMGVEYAETSIVRVLAAVFGGADVNLQINDPQEDESND